MKTTTPAERDPLVIPFKQFFTREYPCSRARANVYASSGELKTFVDRGRRYVLMSEVRAFVRRKAAKGGTVPPAVRAQKSAAGKKGRAAQMVAMRADQEGV
jgi:hypothetical protein